MSNWTPITADDLKATGYGIIIDKAKTTQTGSTDPVGETIVDAVARVRRAVAAGNSLDADSTKVPNSLKAVAMRIVVFALMDRLRLSLTEDQRETRRNDIADLNRICDAKQRVEVPDMLAADNTLIQSQPAPRIHKRHRDFTNRKMDGI